MDDFRQVKENLETTSSKFCVSDISFNILYITLPDITIYYI